MTIEMYQDVMNHLQIDKYRELIIEQDQKITELEKACEETQELLDKQIEATYRLDKENAELKKQNKILSKALNLYINWADECGIAWDNFPDMTEKWYKIVEEKGLGWIAGLTFMVMEEAKEQLASEVEK